MTFRTVGIDMNVRTEVPGDTANTFTGFEDVQGGPIPEPGERVRVVERETGWTSWGKVTHLDEERELIFLSVNWSVGGAP